MPRHRRRSNRTGIGDSQALTNYLPWQRKASVSQTRKSANIQVVEESHVGNQALHDVIVAIQANRRTGSANTKTRGEVAATGKKPFRQKGTGRARQGGNASPINRGGGVVIRSASPRLLEKSSQECQATRLLQGSHRAHRRRGRSLPRNPSPSPTAKPNLLSRKWAASPVTIFAKSSLSGKNLMKKPSGPVAM